MKNSIHHPIRAFLLIVLCIGSSQVAVRAQSAATLCKLSIKLLLNTNAGSANTADACVLAYKNGFSAGTGPEDSYKFTNLDENIAISNDGKLLSIDGRPPFTDTDSVMLNMWQYRQTSYLLQFDAVNFPAGKMAMLVDNFLGTMHGIDLAGQTIIGFNLTSDPASSASDRFCIVLKPLPPPVTILKYGGYKDDQGIMLTWTTLNEANVDHYEIERSTDLVNFTHIADKDALFVTGPIARHQWVDLEMQNQRAYYRIRAVGREGQSETTGTIKVATANANQGTISIYPNPCNGNRFSVQLNNIPAGSYFISLYFGNGNGAMFTTTVQHPGGNSVMNVPVPRYMPKGIYNCVISDGVKTYNKILVLY